jgi:hypothetical protein
MQPQQPRLAVYLASRDDCPGMQWRTLNDIVGAHLDWPESKGLNGWERKALELAEERSQLG